MKLNFPRLELMSARVLAVLMDNVLKAQVKIDKVRYWLDSKTALYWIYNEGQWKQLVQHRVKEILELSKKVNWSQVDGVNNPADLGSRGANSMMLRALVGRTCMVVKGTVGMANKLNIGFNLGRI